MIRMKAILFMTAKIAIVASIIVAITCLSACCPSQDQTRPYLILYAFSEEGTSIRANMSSVTVERHLGRDVARGKLSGRDVVLAELGIGMNNAAMTAQRMLDEYNPVAVIVSGIAGAVDSSVQIGDIVVCARWVVHDYGYIGGEGFVWHLTEIALPDSGGVTEVAGFDADSLLVALAESLISDELNIGKVHDRKPRLRRGGVGVSGNTFIDNEGKRLWLSGRFGAMITDMESAAVAQVCAVNDVPFIAFRSASDLAGGSGSETARAELEEFFKVAAENSSTVVMKFLERL